MSRYKHKLGEKHNRDFLKDIRGNCVLKFHKIARFVTKLTKADKANNLRYMISLDPWLQTKFQGY